MSGVEIANITRGAGRIVLTEPALLLMAAERINEARVEIGKLQRRRKALSNVLEGITAQGVEERIAVVQRRLQEQHGEESWDSLEEFATDHAAALGYLPDNIIEHQATGDNIEELMKKKGKIWKEKRKP